MPKTIRNEYDKKLSYESLMQAHKKSKKGKASLLSHDPLIQAMKAADQVNHYNAQ